MTLTLDSEHQQLYFCCSAMLFLLSRLLVAQVGLELVQNWSFATGPDLKYFVLTVYQS